MAFVLHNLSLFIVSLISLLIFFEITMQIFGSLEASSKISDYKDRRLWIAFDSVQNLVVGGGGTINGNGQVWWPSSCKINKSLVIL